MNRILLALIFLFSSGILIAHPMGNFSINHYAAFSIDSDGVRVHYIIDLAEIPTFQAMSELDLNGDKKISAEEGSIYAAKQTESYKQNLRLSLNGQISALEKLSSKLQVISGAGGLPTLLISADYFAPWKSVKNQNSIQYQDSNFSDRIGWKEIVLPNEKDHSKRLTQYPSDPTISPPQQTEISFAQTKDQVIASGLPKDKNDQAAVRGNRDDRFTRLITTQDLSTKVLLLSLIIAFVLGAMHALSPGHGKTIVAGYLVGSRGTAYHAIFLGCVVTLTHTIGVFALGIITLLGSRYILPERLYPWIGFLSGVSIIIVGASLFRKRLHALHAKHHHHHDHNNHHHHDHDHHHHHDEDHHHDHGHSHLPVDAQTGDITWKSLLTIGISGGALPCPSALVVLLSAISLHRIAFGLLLIVAFSLGLAVVLTSIGLLLVYASQFTNRFHFKGSLMQRLPIASSLIITILGCVIAVKSLFL
jgi:ABC-type nickel/cobalt efflux system permease component RcnA